MNRSNRSQKFFKIGVPKSLKACKFMKKRHQHRCFPVNIAKFLRTAFLKNTSKTNLYRAKTNLLITQQPTVIIKTTSTTTVPPIAAPIIIVLSLVFVGVDVGCTN